MAIPYPTLAKWAGIGILALAVVIGIVRGVETVKAWSDAYDAQPALTAARDQAFKDRDAAKAKQAAQADQFAASLGDITGRILALEARYGEFEAALAKAQFTIDASVAHFKELTAHASPNALPGSPDDLLIRRSLLDIIANPDTGLLTRSGSGDGKGASGPDLRGTTGSADSVPGQRPAAANVHGAVVPAAKQGDRRGAKRTAQGRSRRSLGLGSHRTPRTIEAERVGPALPDCVVTVCGPGHYGTATAQALTELAQAAVAKLHG
jgi:hypothetical protein